MRRQQKGTNLAVEAKPAKTNIRKAQQVKKPAKKKPIDLVSPQIDENYLEQLNELISTLSFGNQDESYDMLVNFVYLTGTYPELLESDEDRNNFQKQLINPRPPPEDWKLYQNNLSRTILSEYNPDAGIKLHHCPKCGNNTLSKKLAQLRALDEAPTLVKHCSHCNYR